MSDGAPALEAPAQLARESKAREIASEAQALAARLAERRFYLACIGQFKRGKSTLINALLGTTVLPTAVVPVTAVATVVRYGEPAARVRLDSDEWVGVGQARLADWVSPVGNPSNRKRVVGVEVFVPSPLLTTGMCLVDTPGLGSVFAANSRATHELVRQIDAAIVVLGAGRHALEARLRAVLHEVRQTTARALDRARMAQAAGRQAVERELDAVDDRVDRLRDIAPASALLRREDG